MFLGSNIQKQIKDILEKISGKKSNQFQLEFNKFYKKKCICGSSLSQLSY